MEAPTRRTASSEMTTAAMAPEPRVRRLKEKSSSFDDTPSLKKKCQKTYLLIKVSCGDVYYLVTASVLMEVICCLGSSTPSDAREIGGKKSLA